MKTFVNLTVYILILTGLYSCNSDVFVDDFRTADTELSLDGNGDTAIIKFASSNWDYLSLYIYDDSFRTPFQVHDERGSSTVESSPYMKGLGRIVSKEELTDFIIERSNPKELKITVGENARPYPLNFVLIASNEYESQDIYVDISPSDRYVINKIYYPLDDPYHIEKRWEEVSSFVLHNYTDEPYTYTLSPYEKIHYEVMFRLEEPEALQLLGKDNLVDIPSVENERLVMSGIQAQYTPVVQTLPFLNSEQKEITIPPMTSQKISLLIKYVWFDTTYAITAVHPVTKKERYITGRLQGKMPVSYLYIKPKITND
ncbi:hypothetical protein [uncultured Bacteroides sp.]|uniref:hypothetical protein n=1 Tax=uncultured Bacteroides sp. TaxID=162156 RepID=UPI0025FF8E77|nr:hypothetical protein [uncultured Bacteroides sp.]